LGGIEKIVGRTQVPEVRRRRPGDVQHSQASIAKAGRLLGFIARVGFEQGLEQTVDWFWRSGRAGHGRERRPWVTVPHAMRHP
jgi:nucleoside-diphosphate-sugar epimerase